MRTKEEFEACRIERWRIVNRGITWCPQSISIDRVFTLAPLSPVRIHEQQPEVNLPKMENGENEARDPSGFLSAIIGAPVTVKLNSGLVYKGKAIYMK